MRSAIESIQPQQPAQIIIAIPVAFKYAVDELLDLVDFLVCLMMPQPFIAIGSWYRDFSQTTDAQVCELLTRSTLDT